MSSLQKKIASKVLKVGVSKIWLDPKQKKDIEAAITAIDVRKLIEKKYIKAHPAKIKVIRAKGRNKKGIGRRKGSKHSLLPSKRKWIATIRPLRARLKELRRENLIDNQTHRKLYLLVKGGMFRSRSHLQIYLDQHGIGKRKVEEK